MYCIIKEILILYRIAKNLKVQFSKSHRSSTLLTAGRDPLWAAALGGMINHSLCPADQRAARDVFPGLEEVK